ncbi:hypothetical protein PVK06_044189 [Gossypium arboreum]|uniref:Dehydrogenase E1 component domain-containing protein n=1 Tax=Gossypium arboreum TaxID=29729 RepID=A0ABR0MQL9_GOSAR|nr:hypothetical protein PVK06_044189 [Gossypium arboreum]
MAIAFSATKFAAQLFPFNIVSLTSQNNPLTIPTTISPFLGSTRKLIRLSSSSNLNLCRRNGTIVTVSDVVKEKKSKSTLNLMYYKMFSFVHLYNGQEAVSTGFIKLLKQQDSIVSTYRDPIHALSKGVSTRAVSKLFSKTTGYCRGQGGSMHMFSWEHNVLGGFAFISERIFVATGAAFTSEYKREVLKEVDCDHVTLAFSRDETCNNGQFFGATSDSQIYKKGSAFEISGVHVDEMDVLKVKEVAKEAIDRVRRGEGPTLVECETYRFRGHSLADPDELRDPAARDPITALKKYFIENSLASEADLKAINKKIDQVVEEAVEFADENPVPLQSQLLQNVFADPKRFGIGPDGRCRCEDPTFTEDIAQV